MRTTCFLVSKITLIFICFHKNENNNIFKKNVTVIACKPAFPPYLAALNPTDQVFDFEELEYHYLVANRTEDVTSKGKRNAQN